MTSGLSSRKVNDTQLLILRLLLKFRFATSMNIAEYFASSNPGMDVYRKLRVLENRGLIGKRYGSKYRLLGRPAEYYLLPQGLRVLSSDPDPLLLRRLYKNQVCSDSLVLDSISLFHQYLCIKRQHRDDLNYLVKDDISQYDYFPEILPDSYFSINGQNHYFLYLISDNTPNFKLAKSINSLLDYVESDEWAVTGTEPPVILFTSRSHTKIKYLMKLATKRRSIFSLAGYNLAFAVIDTSIYTQQWERIDEKPVSVVNDIQ